MQPNRYKETKLKSLMSSQEKLLLAEAGIFKFIKQDNGIFIPYITDNRIQQTPTTSSSNSFGIWVFPLLYSFIDCFIGRKHFLIGEALGSTFSRLGTDELSNDVLNTCLSIGEKRFSLLSNIAEVSQIGISFLVDYEFVPGLFLVPTLYAVIPDAVVLLENVNDGSKKKVFRSGLGIIRKNRKNKANSLTDCDVVKYSVGLNRHPSLVIADNEISNEETAYKPIYTSLNAFIRKCSQAVATQVLDGDKLTYLYSALDDYRKFKPNTKIKHTQVIIENSGVYINNYDSQIDHGNGSPLKESIKKSNNLNEVANNTLELLMDGNKEPVPQMLMRFGSVDRQTRCSFSLNTYFMIGNDVSPNMSDIKKNLYNRYGYMKDSALEMRRVDDPLYLNPNRRRAVRMPDGFLPVPTPEEFVHLIARTSRPGALSHSSQEDHVIETRRPITSSQPSGFVQAQTEADNPDQQIISNAFTINSSEVGNFLLTDNLLSDQVSGLTAGVDAGMNNDATPFGYYATTCAEITRALNHFNISREGLTQVGVYITTVGQLARYPHSVVGTADRIQGHLLVAIEFYNNSTVEDGLPCLTLKYRTAVLNPVTRQWHLPAPDEAYDRVNELGCDASFHDFSSTLDTALDTAIDQDF